MARIGYVEPENAAPDVAKIFTALAEARPGKPVLRLWKTAAHAPEALPHMVKLANALLFKGKLDQGLRELAILRVATLIDCEYERRPHFVRALEVGLSQEQVIAIRDWKNATVFSPVQQAVLQFVDEVTLTARATDSTFSELGRFLSEDEMVELTLVSANYGMLGRMLLVFGVEPE